MSGERIRAFVALETPPALQARIQEAVARLRPQLPGVRFSAAAGLHLTLRFLGASAPAQLARLQPALREAAQACPALEVRVSGAGMFPGRGSPRVLWIGLVAPSSLGELQAACEQAAQAAGFAPEPRAFAPHLTLGRWRARAPRPRLPQLELGQATLDTLVLYSSELRPEGSRYTALAAFPLAGRA